VGVAFGGNDALFMLDTKNSELDSYRIAEDKVLRQQLVLTGLGRSSGAA
jgi:hypothetical protein